MKTIEEQKAIADNVLGKLEAVDPYCILAGGAPMDWYLGRPAKDLDIYFYSAADKRTTGAVNRQLKSALGDLYKPKSVKEMKKCRGDDDVYKHMKYLRRIVDIEVDGMPVQLIEMVEPTFTSVVPEFASDAVKCWYTGDGNISGTDCFYIAHSLRFINLCNGYTSDNKYIAKLKNKLPRYMVTNNTQYMVDLFVRMKVRDMKNDR